MFDKFRSKVFMLKVMTEAKLDITEYVKEIEKEFGSTELQGIKILAENI